jgi:L,D-transpeptidase YcbB
MFARKATMLRVSTLSPLAHTVTGLWLPGFFCVSSAAALSLPEQTTHHLYRRLQMVPVPQTIVIRGEPLAALPPLRRFYAQRDYQPAWSHESQLSPSVGALITAIREAEREGLTAHDYHLAAIETEVHHRQEAIATSRPGWLAELDLFLTDAFLLYASHLLHGSTSPSQENAMWGVERDNVDPAAVLQAALATNTVIDSLQRLLPSHPAYAKLQQALAQYRELAAGDGWPTVPIGPTLRKGDQGTRVAMLRTRLAAESDLPREDVDTGDFFDGAVEQAVQSFQRRHVLDDDGVVGPLTLAALNVSAEHRVQQIILNMERWRWLPRELGPRAVIANSAGFLLEVVEQEHPVLTMRIVVGKPFTRTPIFHAAITSSRVPFAPCYTSGIREHFHKTMLNEFYRIALRKKLYETLAVLQTDADTWLGEYNEARPHQGRWCYGKMPLQTFLDSIPLAEGRSLRGRSPTRPNKLPILLRGCASLLLPEAGLLPP